MTFDLSFVDYSDILSASTFFRSVFHIRYVAPPPLLPSAGYTHSLTDHIGVISSIYRTIFRL